MRTCVALIMFGLALGVATEAKSEWSYVGATDRRQFTVYFDYSTKLRDGDSVKIWSLRDYQGNRASDGRNPLWSEKFFTEYNCKQDAFRHLAHNVYDGNMGNGKVVWSTSDSEDRYSPIVPNSIASYELKSACAN